MNAVRKVAVHDSMAHDATVRNDAMRTTIDSIPKTLHVISPLNWIVEAFAVPLGTSQTAATPSATSPATPAALLSDVSPSAASLPDCEAAQGLGRMAQHDGVVANDAANRISTWRIVRHGALEPARGLAPDDAIWIAPETLVSLNAWRERQDLEPLMFRAPRPDWPERLPGDLAGRGMVVATAAEIAVWHEFPAELGTQPWSQLCNGRVAGFNAARRNLDALQSAVSDAPAESNIMLSGHVPGISEEWNVLVHRGVAAAASPYCIHTLPDSHAIVTVFDLPADGLYAASESEHPQPESPQPEPPQSVPPQPAHPQHAYPQFVYPQWHFHRRYRAIATQAAERTAAAIGTSDASILVAFRAKNDLPIILEIDPVWCSTPYPYDAQGMRAFMESIAEARLLPSDCHASGPSVSGDSATAQQQDNDFPFIPDPWMVARYANRYRSY